MSNLTRRSFLRCALVGLGAWTGGGLCSQAQVPGQTSLRRGARIAWLKQHSLPIRTIDPKDTDYSDLRPIANAIGGARVVMLGEAYHHGGNTFLAKSRLVKFLHQEMGFSVLALESGFYSCRLAWDYLRKGEDALNSLRQGVIMSISESRETQELVHYLATHARTERPLELVGFDFMYPQHIGARHMLMVVLQNWLLQRNPSLLQSHARAFEGTFDELLKDSALLAELEREMAAGKEGGSFWVQQVKTMRAQALANEGYASGTGQPYNIRDAQMADNLLWHTNGPYRDRKIIAWGHIAHFVRNVDRMEPVRPEARVLAPDAVPMGHHVWKALGNEL